MENIPAYISVLFGCTTLATLIFFYFAVRRSESFGSKAYAIAIGMLVWLLLQALLTLKNVYNTNTTDVPPKFLLLVVPPLLLILMVFATKKGRSFTDSLPLYNLTFLNVIRVPVELVLYWLFLNKAVPELMTFAGRNFDILAGITAPLVAYFGIRARKFSNRILLLWNIIALGLLLNIVVNAVFSAPFAFQKFAIEQPNIAILYFPFSWLPAFVVPVVLFGHLVAIRQLIAEVRRG
jgi:hypothetical protein